MHLRSVTLKGFKSFPDRTRLEFGPGVAVVVGPNGSGKSNITDAVLWALGEQSPVAVRGQSMQDVIFAGAHGVSMRNEAEVEVVIDNGDGGIDLPMSEIAISRRLDRSGEGEYRVNGARARLQDVMEILSDSGLGREMHSVVSQGRVEAIVTSKPKDRRTLIEEAAGLGKHRRRRRRAQLKLDRTQDNLDRALDVEREARTRLKPLKRQAEAAELHERIERQALEARWELARDTSRIALAARAEAEARSTTAREAAAAIEAELAKVAQQRQLAEAALAARGAERESLSARFYAARSAAERIDTRLEAASAAAATLTERAARRRALVEALEGEVVVDDPDDAEAQDRVRSLEAELDQLASDRAVRVERELVELEQRHGATRAEVERLTEEARARTDERALADAACDKARAARREAEVEADKARREVARLGAELAAANQFLRLHAAAPGGASSLGSLLKAEPGYELALAAVLGPLLRAAVAPSLDEAATLLTKAGRDGGSALVSGRGRHQPSPPTSKSPTGGSPLLDHVSGDPLAQRLLADVWVVDEISEDFAGIAVTRAGRVWVGTTGELRQAPEGGEDRVLAERNRRDTLITAVEVAAQAEVAAGAAVEQASTVVAEADAVRDAADQTARGASRALQMAADADRLATQAVEQRRRAPDDEATATRRAQIAAALDAERRLLERTAREREMRAQRITAERERAGSDEALLPLAEQFAEALSVAATAVRTRAEAFDAELRAERETGERLAGDLRAGAQAEVQVQSRLKLSGEEVTRTEVRAQQARDLAGEAERELVALGVKLGFEPEPATEALSDDERTALHGRIERLAKRRETLGPVNPLARDEYADAIAHVEELEHQREDLESALRELQGIIRDTDKRIREAFEETFNAAAKNFEDVAAQLFPGGRGRLRLVREDAGPRPVLGGADGESGSGDESATTEEAIEAAAELEEKRPEDLMGVEIEITPAGKSTKRLSLLSGGEKSMTALAFLFAVFLARPCPFYILDEVEAALDDANIDRFLGLLRRYSDRAQFIVVTHQKRTMEAADCLYGVSMAGNGVSKVISRKLPPPQLDGPPPQLDGAAPEPAAA